METIKIKATLINKDEKVIEYKEYKDKGLRGIMDFSESAIERVETSIKNGWIKKAEDKTYVNCSYIVTYEVVE